VFILKILALETSTGYCSVALWQDGAILDRCELLGQKHSERLLEMIDALLKDAGSRIRDVDGIAFGAGPGSFTGVRIACGVAQGLALGANLPVVGVCTLQALAQASAQDRVIAALDARMAEVYHAVYEKRGAEWFALSEPSVCLPQHAPLVEGTEWFGMGSGFLAHGAALEQCYAGQLVVTDARVIPQASAVAQLASAKFALGQGGDAALAMPLYLRDRVALKTCER